jgi:hypothetical protein
MGELPRQAGRQLATPHVAGLSVATSNTLRMAMELL